MNWYDLVKSQTKIEGPYGWIQWKGTNVCMDLHCSCGHHGHVDADFFYGWKCSHCGKKWLVGDSVKLVEATPEVAAEDWPRYQSDDPFDDDGDVDVIAVRADAAHEDTEASRRVLAALPDLLKLARYAVKRGEGDSDMAQEILARIDGKP